jgi:hypothetical protein
MVYKHGNICIVGLNRRAGYATVPKCLLFRASFAYSFVVNHKEDRFSIGLRLRLNFAGISTLVFLFLMLLAHFLNRMACYHLTTSYPSICVVGRRPMSKNASENQKCSNPQGVSKKSSTQPSGVHVLDGSQAY